MHQTLKIVSNSPEETVKTGVALAKQLGPGSVVALYGPLGAGKTCLVSGICKGLGAQIPTTSPSFVILNIYPGDTKVFHLDLYRLKSIQELIDLGYEEYFYGKGVCVVEWAEKAEALLSKSRWDVYLQIVSDAQRKILMTKREP